MQAHGPSPDPGQVGQHALGLLQVEAASVALVIVAQHQAAIVMHQGGGDAGRAIVVLGCQDGFADGVQVAAGQPYLAVEPVFVHEQPQLIGQFRIEIITDEAEIVVVAADPARRLQAFACDDAFPHAKTQVIRIHGQGQLLVARIRAHHVRMRFDGADIQGRRQEARFAQQPRMPVRGPALVHDLAGIDRVEIKRFFAHGEKDIAFPVGQFRRVARDEPQQVILGLRRQRRALRRARRRRHPGFTGQAPVAA